MVGINYEYYIKIVQTKAVRIKPWINYLKYFFLTRNTYLVKIINIKSVII